MSQLSCYSLLLPLAVLTAGCIVVTPISPSNAPLAGASSQPGASPAPITGKVLFKDDFEGGLSDWHLWSSGGAFTLKSALTDAQSGAASVAFGNSDNEVTSPLDSFSGHMVSKKTINLAGTQLPRLRFFLKGQAKAFVTVNWLDMTSNDPAGIIPSQMINKVVQFDAAQDEWKAKDVDLSPYKGRTGLLQLYFNTYEPSPLGKAGPKVDNLVVFDAGQ